jgi:4'-phosphopantetheinyl transferase
MPVIHREHITGDSELALWKVTESNDELISLLNKKGKYPDIPFFRNPSRLAEWLAARALLAELGVKQRVGYDEHGKPHLEGAGLYLSISHSHGFIAVIISKKNRVGIDIEQTGDRIHRVSHKFVNESEKAWLPEINNTLHLYVIWGAKECAFKIYGYGSVDFKDHLEVRPFELNSKGHTSVIFKKDLNPCEYRVFFQSLENMMITYAIAE